MFSPSRILQAVGGALILSGCASAPPQAPVSSPPPAAATAASRTAPAPAQAGDFVRPDGRLEGSVQAFAEETARTLNLPLDHVEALLHGARYDATTGRLMAPPAPGRRIRRAWTSYRTRHVDPERIRLGTQFWTKHRAELEQASRRTGVPPSIIVAIIGIETVYGRYTGEHRVLDVLATLAFRNPDPARPARIAMFRAQLADLIALDAQGWLDARTVRGSYAGAMGLPQFMPGSLKDQAVDGDGDGRIDLQHSTADAIASVAAFLQAHGWVAHTPVLIPARVPDTLARQAQDGLQPETRWTTLQARGVRVRGDQAAPWMQQPLGLIDLQDELRGTHSLRVATPNFFALTHYNRSYFYAAAVTELAQAIATRMGETGPIAVR